MKNLNLKNAFKSLLMIMIASAITTSGCKKGELDLNKPGNLVPKTVDEDPSLPSISVNGTRLHAETYGNPDSAMVVVLHGGPGSDYRSELNAKNLANKGYYVIFYDQRGSGLSQRHDKSVYSLQLFVDDLSAVIHHYKKSAAQKVFLFGHSWGAMLATQYVNQYPSKISGVILAEPGGFTFDDMKDYVSRCRPNEPLNELSNDALYQDQFITGKESEQEILDYKSALMASNDFAPGNMVGNPGPYPFWRYGSVVSKRMFEIADDDGFDFTTNLDQYHTKVLFLYSENNRAYGLSHAQKVSSAYPNVQLGEIKGSGHEMIHFAWDKMSPLVVNYLNSLK